MPEMAAVGRTHWEVLIMHRACNERIFLRKNAAANSAFWSNYTMSAEIAQS
jgi:hypothetical protein